MPDDWSDSDDDELVETNVLLGVPDGPIAEPADLADAAVSRIGGHPAFLPKQAPPLDDAKCSECAAQMELVLQIWCPFQDSPMDRALYVWACPMPRCQGKHGSVRAFRGLRFNAAYAAKLARKKQREAARAKATADAAKPPPKPQHNPFSLGAQGQLAPNLFAPPPSAESQCGADKHNGAPESESDSDSEASLVLALASTTIEDTPWDTTPAYPALYLSTEEEYAPAPSTKRKPAQDPLATTDDVDPSAWSAEKYENSLDTDKVFDRFSQRVAWRGEQCVRYDLEGTPLPYANDKLFTLLWPNHVYNPSAVPKCPACQTARVFECQLMPNLISVIAPAATPPANEEERRAAVAAALKRETKGMDWGTVLIFSCPNDECRSEWKEESCPCVVAMKFPHTKAQLAAIARHYKPTDFDNDDDNDDAVRHVVALLADEDEDGLKRFLKDSYAVDDDAMEQCVLDLMHKHRDDLAGVPFLFLTPTRRPISRPSSRASMTSSRLHPARPDTPSSAPASPLVHVFRRPHTPATSPLAPAPITSTRSDYSPSSSPILSHAATHHVTTTAQYTASLPASPLSSPRLLNAKANEFRPIPRPLSAAATTPGSLIRNDTPPPDMWAHNSPRATSNLAIAAPLIADHPGTYSPTGGGSFTRSLTPSSGLRSSYAPGMLDDSEDDTEDIFASGNPIPSFHSITISDYDQYDPWTQQDADGTSAVGQGAAANANAAPFPIMYGPWGPEANEYGPMPHLMGQHHALQQQGMPGDEDPLGAGLTDGMTPFDVLSSVFGSTLAPSELEEALAVNGYDFDRAMAWLVDRAMPQGAAGGAQQQQQQQPQVQGAVPGRMQHMGAGVTLVSRQGLGIRGGLAAGGGGRGYAPLAGPTSINNSNLNNGNNPASPPGSRPAPRYVNGRPVPSGNRVCRYFVAGECLRADCRFSHDLERALCRFWLRGTCAKGDACEFLHHLPKDVDVGALNAVLARANVAPGQGPLGGLVPPGGMGGAAMGMGMGMEEFPALGYEGAAGQGGMGGVNGRRGSKYGAYAPNDPGRTRFAAAVKKPVLPHPGGLGTGDDMNGHASASSNSAGGVGANNGANGVGGRRDIGGPSADNLHHQSAIVAPRPSPRLKLRPPTLLPTLPTGESVNALYMTYRSRALQLGGARNACLSRAADAWRRGDGAAAKRFSREGHDLNAKMSAEMGEAARKLVRERARVAEGAVRGRDAGWSDEPGDRTARGKSVGNGLGVCLGIASASAVAASGGGGGGTKASVLTPEERTEVMLDLHGLHSNEAIEVLEAFLLGLEREHFFGLAYAIVGEEKHTGSQDPTRGVSRARLATGVREWLHKWGYPWSDRDGIICIDPLTHASE